MNCDTSDRSQGHFPPNLALLRLIPNDLKHLARQGSVVAEQRSSGPPIYKLRFRRAGRQVVRYIGRDSDRAAAVRAELVALQAKRRSLLAVKQLTREASRLLQETKRALSIPLENKGFYFHGRAIRFSRRLARNSE